MSGRDFTFTIEGPLDTAPAQGQMRAANISGFQSLVRSLGGDPRRILERHGIDPVAIADPDYFVDRAAAVSALEYCSAHFDEPLFGLRLAEAQSPEVFGCVTAAARVAPRVREGLQCYLDHLPVVHSADGALELIARGDLAELRWCAPPDFELSVQAVHQALLLDHKILSMLAGRNFRPAYATLAAHMRAKDAEAISHKLGCPLHTQAAVDAMGNPVAYALAFPIGMLDWPVPSADKVAFSVLGGYLRQMKSAARLTLVEQVEAYVRGALSSRRCSIARCAQKLGIPMRTLQWRLAESGVSFSDVLVKQRIDIAGDCLRHGQLLLEDIATLLGYSDQASFGRAFKRWTGRTPQEFRTCDWGTR